MRDLLFANNRGFSNVGDGISLADPHRGRCYVGIGSLGAESVEYDIRGDGTVVILTEGWEAITSDGMLRGFRGPEVADA